MNRKVIQCRGCVHADIQVISVYRPGHPLSYLGREANELSIYCKKRGFNVRYPWEQCNTRQERPKIPIDQW